MTGRTRGWLRKRRGSVLAALFLVTFAKPGLPHPVSAGELSSPFEFSPHYLPGDRFMGIRLLGAVALRHMIIDGQLVAELSGLAWDRDEQILYAVSDGGRLFHLKPAFEAGILRGVAGVAGFALRDENGRRLRGVWADSEGLALENADNGIRGDSVLVVAFERRPRLARYTPRGRFLGELPLPAGLSSVANYASANKSLESVAHHPEFGWLTAPERPMAGDEPGSLHIWNGPGDFWRYPLRAVPNNSLVAMEVLPGGSLLTLERGHGLFYLPVVISLRRFRLPAPNSPAPLEVSTAAVFDSSRGWRVDNFEGLTRLDGLRFLLVSDDNENAMQRTLLLQIELVDPEPRDYSVPEYDALQKNTH